MVSGILEMGKSVLVKADVIGIIYELLTRLVYKH
jgi:hypothetical protein